MNSATTVGIIDVDEGVDEPQNADRLWSVLTLMPLPGNRVVTMVCRLCSLPGVGPDGRIRGAVGDEVDGERRSDGEAEQCSDQVAFHDSSSPVDFATRGPVRLEWNVLALLLSLSPEHGVSPTNGRCIDRR